MAQLTVSLPTYNCPQLPRAVESILGQTFTDFTLVVVNDGGDQPELPGDRRLVYFELQKNRGRYYADAVTLAACQTEWFTVHDADDWSDPSRYAHMLALSNGHQVIAGGLLNYDLKNQFRHPAPPKRTSTPQHMNHLWHMSALYRTEALRGLIHPGFRVGYDTLLANLLSLSADVGFDDALLYHRVRREGSLTTHPATNIRSPLRRAEARDLLNIWRRVSRNKPDLDNLRRFIVNNAGPQLLADVEADAARLRLLLGAS